MPKTVNYRPRYKISWAVGVFLFMQFMYAVPHVALWDMLAASPITATLLWATWELLAMMFFAGLSPGKIKDTYATWREYNYHAYSEVTSWSASDGLIVRHEKQNQRDATLNRSEFSFYDDLGGWRWSGRRLRIGRYVDTPHVEFLSLRISDTGASIEGPLIRVREKWLGGSSYEITLLSFLAVLNTTKFDSVTVLFGKIRGMIVERDKLAGQLSGAQDCVRNTLNDHKRTGALLENAVKSIHEAIVRIKEGDRFGRSDEGRMIVLYLEIQERRLFQAQTTWVDPSESSPLQADASREAIRAHLGIKPRGSRRQLARI